MVSGYSSIQAVVSAEALFVCKNDCRAFVVLLQTTSLSTVWTGSVWWFVREAIVSSEISGASFSTQTTWLRFAFDHHSLSFAVDFCCVIEGWMCVAEEESGGILQKQRIGLSMAFVLPMMQHCLCRRPIRNLCRPLKAPCWLAFFFYGHLKCDGRVPRTMFRKVSSRMGQMMGQFCCAKRARWKMLLDCD